MDPPLPVPDCASPSHFSCYGSDCGGLALFSDFPWCLIRGRNGPVGNWFLILLRVPSSPPSSSLPAPPHSQLAPRPPHATAFLLCLRKDENKE